MYRIYWTVLITFLISQLCAAQDVCVQTGPCTCTNSKGTIDLSPLASTSSDPKFKDIKEDTGTDMFSYNPCNDFTEGDTGCIGVAACQVQAADPNMYFSLGPQSSAKFITNADSSVQVEYNADTENFLRTAEVKLICDPSTEAQMDVAGEVPPDSGIYLMKLTSKYACPSGTTPTTTTGPGTPGGGLSIGSILLIAALGIVLGYAIFGITIQMFVRKAEGRERIPNYAFWSGVPGYIRDGVLFVVRRGKISKSYDNI